MFLSTKYLSEETVSAHVQMWCMVWSSTFTVNQNCHPLSTKVIYVHSFSMQSYMHASPWTCPCVATPFHVSIKTCYLISVLVFTMNPWKSSVELFAYASIGDVMVVVNWYKSYLQFVIQINVVAGFICSCISEFIRILLFMINKKLSHQLITMNHLTYGWSPTSLLLSIPPWGSCFKSCISHIV